MDRAQKELNIEKQIKKIEDTWAVLSLVFTPLADSDIMQLQVHRFSFTAGARAASSTVVGARIYTKVCSLV